MLPKFVFLTNMVTASVFGFAINLLLLFLINRRTPTEMRSYARIMRIHCLSDMLYDAIQLIAGVHANPIAGKVYMMLQGFVTHVDLTVNRYLFDAYVWSLMFSIALLPIDFVFRYRSVCFNRDLTNKQLYLMVFCAYFVTWVHAFVATLIFVQPGPGPDSAEFTQELQQFPQWAHDVPSFSVSELRSTKALANAIFIICLNSFSYGVILFTFVKIRATLKQNFVVNTYNIRSAAIQKQVSRILALQATVPLLVICVPVLTTVALALANCNMPEFGAFDSAVYVWLSAVKPSATILIVPRYRNFVCAHVLRLNGETNTDVTISKIVPTRDTTTDKHAAY